MISKKLEQALNEQLALEAYASYAYLAMASWMENEGYEGTAKFLYAQSDEERMHMLKLFHYINEVGGFAISPAVSAPLTSFNSSVTTRWRSPIVRKSRWTLCAGVSANT